VDVWAMLDETLGVRDGDGGPPLRGIATALPNVLPGVRGNVPHSHRIFEHLPGMPQTLVNRRRPQAAPLHGGAERFAVSVNQARQRTAAELLCQRRHGLPPGP
jgi:hypothetical protein